MTNKQKVRAIFPFAVAEKDIYVSRAYAWSIRLGHWHLSIRNRSEDEAWNDARKNIIDMVHGRGSI